MCLTWSALRCDAHPASIPLHPRAEGLGLPQAQSGRRLQVRIFILSLGTPQSYLHPLCLLCPIPGLQDENQTSENTWKIQKRVWTELSSTLAQHRAEPHLASISKSLWKTKKEISVLSGFTKLRCFWQYRTKKMQCRAKKKAFCFHPVYCFLPELVSSIHGKV